MAQLAAEIPAWLDKNTTHCYVDCVYEDLFAPYRERNITLVELGTYYGGSARLWKSYFNCAELYMLDIAVQDNAFANYATTLPNLHYLIGDAYTPEMAAQVPDFDILIDDGPHTLASQLKAIELFLPKLKPGGVFVIEDIQSINDLDILYDYSLQYKQSVSKLDLRHVKNRYDDLLLIIKGITA